MGIVAQSNTAGKGTKTFTLASANDETTRLSLRKGETVSITCTGMSGSTVQVRVYTNGTTGVAADYNGATSFTADFTLNFTAAGKCSVSVFLTVDGGTVTVNLTR